MLPLSKTNLPASLSFRDREAFFWQVELIRFERSIGRLIIKVSNYKPVDTTPFQSQASRHPVDRMEFEPMSWQELEPFLSAYRKSDLVDLLLPESTTDQPVADALSIAFRHKVAIKDLTFGLGCVTYHAYFPTPGHDVEVSIANPHVIPEFDLIKPFFSKALRRKTIETAGELTLKGNEVAAAKATSKEIDRIDNRMITTLKYQQIQQLKKPLVKVVDKSLFTADEAFDLQVTEGHVLHQDVRDILQSIVEFGGVRNRKQLQYLAGRRHAADHPILLTLQPVFGFLFLIEGASMWHYCWELLNTNATYLWSFDKQQGFDFERIQGRMERIIQQIRDHGRREYKRAYAQGTVGSDVSFQTIIHQAADSSMIDAFPRWRARLEEKLL